MKINTRFDIGDLVKHKYELNTAPNGKIRFIEITGIAVKIGLMDTHVVYEGRALWVVPIRMEEKEDSPVIGWKTAHSIGKEDGQFGTTNYYENELVFASNEETSKLTSLLKHD